MKPFDPWRMTSFSDIALKIPEDAPKLDDTFESKDMTQYLKGRYASSKKIGSWWILQVDEAVPQSLRCNKLAVTSGLTSSPNMPNFPRSHDWIAPILHHRDFEISSKPILAASSVYTNITVLGGDKSAADLVYASVKAGKNVKWIVRKTGEGPWIFMNPTATGRYKNEAEAGATQKASVLNPSGFRPLLEWARMLHHPDSESANLDSKPFAGDRRYKLWANYRGREDALPCFRELEPKAS